MIPADDVSGQDGGMPTSDAAPPTDDEQPETRRVRVCFVCTGNICRSPMAEVVLRELARRERLDERLAVDSAGTGEWHIGEGADPRAVAALADRGYDGSRHRARRFDPADFARLDLVVALDRGHERVLGGWARDGAERARIRRLLSYAPDQRGDGPDRLDIADPYYEDRSAFDDVLARIEGACAGLLAELRPALV